MPGTAKLNTGKIDQHDASTVANLQIYMHCEVFAKHESPDVKPPTGDVSQEKCFTLSHSETKCAP